MNLFRCVFAILALVGFLDSQSCAADLVGLSIIPHSIETSMRYRRPYDPELSARVQLFIKGPATPTTFDGRTPAELLASNEWAWHDLGAAVQAPEEALTVWSFNGKSSRWGVGKQFALQGVGLQAVNVAIQSPEVWISAATFLASDNGLQPDSVVVHLANESTQELRVNSLRLWLPQDSTSWQILWPQEPRPVSTSIPPADKGFVM